MIRLKLPLLRTSNKLFVKILKILEIGKILAGWRVLPGATATNQDTYIFKPRNKNTLVKI